MPLKTKKQNPTKPNEGERGLASIEDSVDTSIQQLENYKEKHEGLITAETILTKRWPTEWQ